MSFSRDTCCREAEIFSGSVERNNRRSVGVVNNKRVQQGDWAISLDLTDAYMHIPIHKAHKKFLRFRIQGKVYQFACLCFCPAVAPRVFTMVVSVSAAHLRTLNLRLAVYLDDWFLVNQIKKLLYADKNTALNLLVDLGFMINLKKISIGTKSAGNLYWGTFPTSKRVSLSNSRESAQNKRSMHEVKDSTYSSELPSFVRAKGPLHRTGSKRKAFHETNTIASPTFLETSKNGHSNSGTIQYSDTKASAILVERRKSTEGKELLCSTLFKNNHKRCLKTGLRRSHGKPTVSGNLVHAGVHNAHKLARTESSLSDSQTFSSPAKGLYCVNTLRQHNSSSVYCKGRGDSFFSPVLPNMGHLAFSKGQQHNTQISSCCRSPERTGRQIKQGENTCKTLGMVTTQYSSPQAFSDLGDASNRLVCIGSKQEKASVLHMVPQSIGTGKDALSIAWENMEAYAFPPICLVPKVLQHMKKFRCQIILIAPQWPRRNYTDLLQMSIACPRKLPVRQDLLFQDRVKIFHPNPQLFNLTAWFLSTDHSK